MKTITVKLPETLAASLSRKFGRLTPQLVMVWSPDDLGSTRRSVYGEASATYAISAKTGIVAAIGRRERTGGPDYTAFNAGISEKLNAHITADLRYYGTDRHNLGYIYQSGLIVSARIRF